MPRPRRTGRPLQLPDAVAGADRASCRFFIAFLREAPNDIPSFSADVLSDKDAADIHAFLRSLPGPKPAKDFPLLNQ